MHPGVRQLVKILARQAVKEHLEREHARLAKSHPSHPSPEGRMHEASGVPASGAPFDYVADAAQESAAPPVASQRKR